MADIDDVLIKSHLSSYRHHKGQHNKDKPEPDLHLREGGIVRFPLRRNIRENKGRESKSVKKLWRTRELKNLMQQQKCKHPSLIYELKKNPASVLHLPQTWLWFHTWYFQGLWSWPWPGTGCSSDIQDGAQWFHHISVRRDKKTLFVQLLWRWQHLSM